jgi:hypothetical protein
MDLFAFDMFVVAVASVVSFLDEIFEMLASCPRQRQDF